MPCREAQSSRLKRIGPQIGNALGFNLLLCLKAVIRNQPIGLLRRTCRGSPYLLST
jgi:hypothetical protein